MFPAFDEAIESIGDFDFVVPADFGEGFVELIGAGLATADVKGGEEGPAGSGILLQELLHGEIRGDFGGHVQKMAENWRGERQELGLSNRARV